MKILYTRTSTIEQSSDRQKTKQLDFDKLVEDKCSGAIPFAERNGGKQVLKYAQDGKLDSISVHEIDRLGRNLRDIINTIHYFTERQVPIIFLNQGLRTIDENGKTNPIANLVISILATVSEMTRNQILESQREGVAIAKMKGKYLGRKKGSKEDTLKFLSKPQNAKALSYLKKGFKATEISKIVGVHINTITKIKQVGLI